MGAQNLRTHYLVLTAGFYFLASAVVGNRDETSQNERISRRGQLDTASGTVCGTAWPIA